MPTESRTTHPSRTSPAISRRTRVGRWLAVIVWAALIFGVSSLPGSNVPGRFGTQAHFIEYAVLSALLYRALRLSAAPWPAALGAVVVASCYGISDELHQAFVPLRVPDVSDWAVDTAGAMCGAALCVLAERTRDRGRRTD